MLTLTIDAKSSYYRTSVVVISNTIDVSQPSPCDHCSSLDSARILIGPDIVSFMVKLSNLRYNINNTGKRYPLHFLPKTQLPSTTFLLRTLPSALQMCEIRVLEWSAPPRGCGHQFSAGYNRCLATLSRPGQVTCAPPAGMRELSRSLDIQDRDLSGKCPACRKITPPSSVGSQG